MTHSKNMTCEAHQRSKAWGDAKPCDRTERGKGLCNGHLAQLGRRDDDETKLTPLRGLHGRKRLDEVQLGSPRVERSVADKVAALGTLLGAKSNRAKYRGIQALAEGYASGALRWARGKGPKARRGS
jgi:hypothetical protein